MMFHRVYAVLWQIAAGIVIFFPRSDLSVFERVVAIALTLILANIHGLRADVLKQEPTNA